MDFKIPTVLTTDRLILRIFQEDDWKDLYEYYSDESCMQYTIGRVLTEGETWRTMASMIGHWQLKGFGPYALEDKTTKKVVGVSGLWYPNDWPEPEIKWGLVPSAWGKGFASEAALAIKNMAFETLKNCNLISLIVAENTNSIKVARSVGASFEKEIVFRDKLCHIYRHSKN